ncbi:site-2 protease family protein [Niastella caeni]|uniref:Zinc metalloprotease n=1 Tax=Niastella caeni TaxID=2569763 RepID=A0A4S8I1G6_9BACT|nr:site-2 protease family protein [Niastella caeni]THU39532.1 site-2 protease family protein [Niastella caeni]
MRGSYKILTVRGISLHIHWTFLLLIGWVLLVNATAGNNIEQISWSVLFLLAVFVCVTLHEFGHALMAARFGIQAKEIVLLPIGGIASIEKFPDTPRQELAISIAGPLVNLVIAGLLWLFIPNMSLIAREPHMTIMHGHDFLYNLRIVNIALAVFNLIPAFPMDGGRILRALLGFKLNYIQATTIAATVGKIIAILFIIAGIVFINPFLPIIGVFIIFSAGAEEYYLRLKSLVKGIKLNEVLMYDYNSLQANMTVQEASNILNSNHSKYFILMDGINPVGAINRMEIIKALADMNYTESLKNLVKEKLEYLNGDKEIDTVLENLARNDERIFPVMDNSHFIGVVNLNHIIEYLLLNKINTKEYPRIRSLAGLLH